jgi:hypothetical protein
MSRNATFVSGASIKAPLHQRQLAHVAPVQRHLLRELLIDAGDDTPGGKRGRPHSQGVHKGQGAASWGEDRGTHARRGKCTRRITRQTRPPSECSLRMLLFYVVADYCGAVLSLSNTSGSRG